MTDYEFTTGQKLAAEFIGSAILVYVLVSSALLSHGMLGASLGVSVLYIGLATAGWLFITIEMFGPISGGHVNPMVTIATLITGDVDAATARAYIPTQFAGGLVGVVLANLTFVSTLGWATFTVSTVSRPPSTYLAEFFGSWVLASVVIASIRKDSDWTSLAVGFTVGMGIIATSSTMFVNPQVALARIFTSAISGIRPFDAVMFAIASTLGGVAAGFTWRYLWPADQPIVGGAGESEQPVQSAAKSDD